MGNKKMQNISTVKVNPYEIAKAPDMDFGFKNILANASILADRFFGYHSPKPLTHSTLGEILEDRDRKDFIIGGGLISDGSQTLRPLPIVAFSNYGGLFVSNGLDVENRPHQIPIGVDFENEGWRIESIYIGNAFDDEQAQGEETNKKKDPNWDEYASEWRASYRIGNTTEDTVFSEFKKRQMQAVRFYVYPGAIEDDKKDARAADTSNIETFKNRVKIAEVLVHCVLDSGNFPRIQPITKDDIRFVTAVQYWEGKVGNTIDPNDIDNYSSSNPTAVGEDNKWVQKAPTVEPNYQPGSTVEEREKARLEAEQKTLNNRAYRAEHYNYRWTNEQTRTYRIGSIAEISERLYKIHQSDGTLKEAVVWHKHINLTSEDRNGLKGSLIPLDSPEQNIELPLGGKIVSYESIKHGLLAVATAMFKQDEKADGLNSKIDSADSRLNSKIDSVDNRLNSKIDSVDNRLNSKIDNHIQQTNVHGATSSPQANRIAMRDGAGRFEVENPVTDKQVVNISYLNSTFRMDVFMQLLKTSYITNQDEFNRWVSQRGNEKYTHVYLKGVFHASRTIKLKDIGTREVIGIENHQGRASIYSTISSSSSDVEAGIDGDGNASLKDIWIEVKGRCSQNNRVIGIEQCSCNGCKAVVVGKDGVKFNDRIEIEGIDGANAISFYGCTINNCEAFAQGGSGGKGYDGNGGWNWTSDGGSGKRGGDAYSIQKCTIKGSFIDSVFGGNGGTGGTGGSVSYNCLIYTNGGNGGPGGTGGDAYGVTGHGDGGDAGEGGFYGGSCSLGTNGKEGSTGSPGTYYYITN